MQLFLSNSRMRSGKNPERRGNRGIKPEKTKDFSQMIHPGKENGKKIPKKIKIREK